MNISFDGKVQDGKLKLYDQQLFLEHVKKFEGKSVTLSLEKGGKRSNQQNRYYWSVIIKYIVEHTGQDADDVHEYLKGKFNAVEFEIPRKDTGEVVDQARIGRTTTKMTTIEFMQYVEKIQRWASEFLGIAIPDPNQTEWLDDH